MQERLTNDLPDKLLPFIWRYLSQKKWCLAGFTFIAIIHAAEISLNPYLLKILINTYPFIKSQIGKDIFHYLLHHSHGFFQNTHTGNITKKIDDLMEVESLVSKPVEFYFRFLTLVVACFTLFIAVNPLFGCILVVWGIGFIYLSFIAAKKSEKYARVLSESSSKYIGTVSDSITNIISTKLFSNISSEVRNVNKDIDVLVKSDRSLQWFNLKVNFLQGIGATLLIGFMVLGLIYGRIKGFVSVGDFALVLALSMAIFEIVYSVGQELQKFAKTIGTCNQALSFIKIPHEITDTENAKPLNVSRGQIKFEKVNFQYESSNPIFNDLNITLNPGEKVGLVGFSGGGKSTFIKLILRLIDTKSGSVLIDGQDIKLVTKESLRKQIGTIPQETELFHRTIMENIRFAKIGASDDEVITAAKKARCHEFINQLPDKYESLVGERGVKLSGGQRQRIAIARAFLKNAPILILDEATSSLDSITEKYIQESLHEVMQGKTTIVIAHRLSTLKDMDRILVFDNGKIVEDGSMQDLLANKQSQFYKLWQMQAGGFISVSSE